MSSFYFAEPQYLLILFLLPLFFYFFRNRILSNKSGLLHSNTGIFKQSNKSIIEKLSLPITLGLRITIIILIILAVGRPRSETRYITNIINAVDIMLLIDVSGSMQAEDFNHQSRLDAAIEASAVFVKSRSSDRIGLIEFAGGVKIISPLTIDYNELVDYINNIDIEYTWQTDGDDAVKTPIEFHNGTFIASAIGEAGYYLKSSAAKSKIIILLTDGYQEGDNFDPITIAKSVAAFGIKIYTIAIGSKSAAETGVPFPIFYKNKGKSYFKNSDGSLLKIPVDENSLKQIAELTGGAFYSAADKRSLAKIYSQIDALEKSKIKIKSYSEYTEYFQILLLVALILFIAESLLKYSIFRRLPE